MSIFLINKNSGLKINKTKQISHEDRIENIFINHKNPRIILNNPDVIIFYEEIPFIKKIYKSSFLRNLTKVKNENFKFFNAVFFKSDNPKTDILQTVTINDSSNIYQLIHKYPNTALIEHLAFYVPVFLKLKGYWIVFLENTDETSNIICGKDKAIIIYRCIGIKEDTIDQEIEKSIKYLQKFIKTKNEFKIHKTAFIKSFNLKKYFSDFDDVKSEFGDIYFLKKIKNNNIIEPKLVINKKEYIKMKINNILRKIIICTIPMILIAIVIHFEKNYNISSENDEISMKNSETQKSIKNFHKKIKEMLLEQSLNNDEKALSNKIMRQQSNDSFLDFEKELEKIETEINNNKNITFGNYGNIDDINNFECILPKGVCLNYYNYSLNSNNNKNNISIELIVTVENEHCMKHLLKNIHKRAKAFNIRSIDKVSEKQYRIQLSK